MVQIDPSPVAPTNDPAGGEILTLEFPWGLPGFEDAKSFTLGQMGEGLEAFGRLQSLDDPSIAFVVVPPGLFFEDYDVEIYDEYMAVLGIDGPEDAMVLVIMTVVPPPGECNLNLLGPIIFNPRTLKGAQVVQYKSNYRPAVPISAKTAH